jgi:hypothetical protein
VAQYVLYLAQFGQDIISKPQGLAIPIIAAVNGFETDLATGLGLSATLLRCA